MDHDEERKQPATHRSSGLQELALINERVEEEEEPAEQSSGLMNRADVNRHITVTPAEGGP